MGEHIRRIGVTQKQEYSEKCTMRELPLASVTESWDYKQNVDFSTIAHTMMNGGGTHRAYSVTQTQEYAKKCTMRELF